MKWIDSLMSFLGALLKWTDQQTTTVPLEPLKSPLEAPITYTPNMDPTTPNPDVLLPWNTTGSLSHENWHNVRVLCDLEGLSHEQKEELTACVWVESAFNVHARLDNKDKAGRVWSSDLGICQYNTWFHPDLASLPYTPNPEKEVRAMCKAWLSGQKTQWVSFTSGAYTHHLGKTL